MRIVRRIIAILILPVLLLLAVVAGTVGMIVITTPGKALLSRLASKWITDAAAGTVEIGSIDGTIWGNITLRNVVIHDSLGSLVLSSPKIVASYNLRQFFNRNQTFNHVTVDSLYLHLVRLRENHWNYEKVFHLGQGPDNGLPPPYMAFRDLTVTNSFVRIDAPTHRGPPHKPVSRNGRMPAQDSIVDSPDGPVRVLTLTGLNASFDSIRVSTPKRDPIYAEVRSLNAAVNNPALTITQLKGHFLTQGDSLLFKFDSAGLTSSQFIGSGRLRWPRDTLLFDLALDAPRVALRDLWWIQPDLPAWTGKGRIVSKAFNTSRTDYHLENLVLGDSRSQLTGKVRLQVERDRGLGMRDLDMQFSNVPIDILRPYLDTLPVSGGMTGHFVADGFLDSMRIAGDQLFADALVRGAPVSHLRFDGLMHFGGVEGAVFEHFKMNQSSIAMGTIHQLVPSIILPGALMLNGQLDGPWKNVNFVGTAEHHAPDGSLSRMIGKVRLDTRALVLGLALDADFDQLSFAALRSGYPDIKMRGGLTGHVIANGNLDSLDVIANLTGEIGTINAVGRVKVDAPNYGADSLVIDLQRLDLGAVFNDSTSSALNGRVVLHGVLDSGQAPRGTVSVALDRSRYGGATVDAVNAVIHADRGMLTVDTSSIIWSAGRVDASGTLGWTAPDSGTLTVRAQAASLAPFDSLVRAFTGIGRDTVNPRTFGGEATALLMIHGARDRNTITGTIDGSQIVLDNWHAAKVAATLRADSLGRRGLTIDATLDTVGSGTHVADRVHVIASGRPDSLHIAGSAGMMALHGSGGGTLVRRDDLTSLRVDSMSLFFPHQAWMVAAPATMTYERNQLTFRDTLRLRSIDGSGDVRISGAVPGDAPGKLDVNVSGLDLLSVFGVLDRDSTSWDGIGSLDLHLAGTREAPTFDGTASILSPSLGDAHFPSVMASFDYANQRLHTKASLWRTGLQVLEGSATLPLDLALAPREQRRLPGELQIAASADSVDMLILEAILTGIRNPTGSMRLDLKGSGTWLAPKLEGLVGIQHGSVEIPSLNVTYAPINALAHFVKDSLRIDSMVIGDSESSMRVSGGMRFAELSKPTMDFTVDAVNFLAIDDPSFLSMRATGQAHLTGPLLQPVLTGDNILITKSVFYFADLITKTVIDLEDPENAALIDTVALNRRGLGKPFTNRFLDSLSIQGLQLTIGPEVWLRSTEANIQLDGLLRVDKYHKEYNLTGDLNTVRGTYRLQFGPISREFTVDQGSVHYFGTPDLNADLGIQAHLQVRTLEGDDFTVVAAINGSILVPKITLTAPGRTLTQRDLASYVLFGRPEFQLNQQGTVGGAAGSAAVNVFIEETFTKQLVNKGRSSGLTNLSLRPATSASRFASAWQFALGWQFGAKWFVTFDAGACLGQSRILQSRNLGASIEYRINREFRVQASGEPVQSCVANRATDVFTTLSRYQFGWNFLWRRDY